MILKASQRGSAGQLAAHLLRIDENDHVEVHELRGFVAGNLAGALREAEAVAIGTRCKQHLFSLSLNPPESATVSDRDFRAAIKRIEHKLGLNGLPRAIVFHEKEGRRHAHCVWSRIESQKMRAVPLPHFKLKLQSVARELYLDHGWRMPAGLSDKSRRDPAGFTLAEWQQAKRTGLDARTVKELVRQCWAASDNGAAFAQALEERGFHLAQGDRRGFVAVDHHGEVYSVARAAGVKTKDVAARLGDPSVLETVEQVKQKIASRMTAALRRHIREVEKTAANRHTAIGIDKRDMVRRQCQERQALQRRQEARRERETRDRAARLSPGLRGLWERLTGRYGRIKRENERDAYRAYQRDQAEKQALIQRQLAERQKLQREIKAAKETHRQELIALRRDVASYTRMGAAQRQAVRERSKTVAQPERKPMVREVLRPQRRRGRIRA
ncbi:relaxase/mobilization nuclease domain-containing protein [Oceanibaculum nanhaiense]|uniref:relaxase/mobilization nuclease domain-containing protein n=1 Tax=Oceanibaculum nanhaiense TaxID=1909734 RepID=UPI003D2B0B12